jgi:hypothetical protein
LPKGGGLCQAALEAFDRHTNVWVPGRDRRGSSGSGYVLWPPPAQERLERRLDGRVLTELAQTEQ